MSVFPQAKYSCIVFLLYLATLSRFSSAQNGCQRLTIDDLGNTTGSSPTGILANVLINQSPSVQVFSMNIVCEAAASQRGEFLYVSAVVNFTDSTRPGSVFVGQVELSCSTDTWVNNVFNLRSFTESSNATFDTPLRSDCRICGTNPVIMNAAGNYDNITHCLACDGCTGLNQCSNFANPVCCNYYINDVCVEECPANVSTLNETVNECFCNPGQTGSMCESDIDECTVGPNPCLNDGNCTNTNGSFMCVCATEFTGDICEEDVNECNTDAANNCMNGGTCNNTIGSFDCLCLSGFTGRFCDEDVNECINGVAQCMNEGMCNNTFGSFECLCPPTYNGSMCEVDVDECLLVNPCANSGMCMNFDGGFNCTCASGFEGITCQNDTDECSIGENPCANGGMCMNFDGGFNCTCASGFEGMTCQNDTDECLTLSPCGNGGTCTNTFGNFNCNCTMGFEGNRCQDDINECNENPCGIGGDCNNTFGGFNCDCNEGFEGERCVNINECAANTAVCMNGGVCNDTDGSFNCTCTPGFMGRVCDMDIDECSVPNACPSNANCENTVGSFTCLPVTTIPPPTPGGISLGIIIAIIVAAVVVIIAVIFLIICCCCCCGRNKSDDYIVPQTSNIVVRTWDPRTQHDRSGSLYDSFKSNGRNSFARSSISSVGSFLRASIRRLSGKRRSGRKGGNNLVDEEEIAMKVTPL